MELERLLMRERLERASLKRAKCLPRLRVFRIEVRPHLVDVWDDQRAETAFEQMEWLVVYAQVFVQVVMDEPYLKYME